MMDMWGSSYPPYDVGPLEVAASMIKEGHNKLYVDVLLSGVEEIQRLQGLVEMFEEEYE